MQNFTLSEYRLNKIVTHLCNLVEKPSQNADQKKEKEKEKEIEIEIETEEISPPLEAMKETLREIVLDEKNEWPLLSKQYPKASQQLQGLLGDRYSEEKEILDRFGREVIGNTVDKKVMTIPQAVVFPKNREEVIEIVKICGKAGEGNKKIIPIICHSGGTSLESHYLATHGGLIMSFKEMNKILKIYKEDMQCVVEPGVNINKLNQDVLIPQYKLLLGVDPSPAACIGGMIGTCCSGPSAFKYGTMLNQVINLTIVLWNGTILKTGQRAMKSVAGYNLNALFVGSEGTLGIVVEITLKLRPVPRVVEIAQAYFDDIANVGKCQNEILQSGIELAAFEFLDNTMVNACKEYYPNGIQLLIPNKHLIIFKFAGYSKKHVDADIEGVQEIVKKYTKYPFIFSSNEQERKRLWNTRKSAFWAAKAIDNSKDIVITDVAVPFGSLSEILVLVKKELDENSTIPGPIIAHIGDGNFHCCLLYDNKNPLEIQEVFRLSDFIVNLALKFQGTCTAEHGIGLRKKKFLFREFSPHTLQFMSNLKHFVDPISIFNPGKVVD